MRSHTPSRNFRMSDRTIEHLDALVAEQQSKGRYLSFCFGATRSSVLRELIRSAFQQLEEVARVKNGRGDRNSEGDAIVCIRIPPLLLAAIDEDIAEKNNRKQGQHWSRSTWLLTAAQTRLAHLIRRTEQRNNTPTHQSEAG